MKKVLLIILIAIIASTSVFADSFSGFGISGIYDNPLENFELGFYSNYYYTFPIEGTCVNMGFGSRLDLSFSIPVDTFSFAFLSGFAIDAELSKRTDLYFILGPQVTILMPYDAPDSIIGIGGGLDAGLTCYFNDERSIGGSFGIANYFSAILPDVGDAYFGYYGGIYAGLTVRFGPTVFDTLPPGYSYIIL